jgi:hypothetical protein
LLKKTGVPVCLPVFVIIMSRIFRYFQVFFPKIVSVTMVAKSQYQAAADHYYRRTIKL